PSIPSASAAAASSIVWFSASAAVGVREPVTGAQWPNERKPIRFMPTMIEQILAHSSSYHWGPLRGRIARLVERLVDQVGQRRAIGGVGPPRERDPEETDPRPGEKPRRRGAPPPVTKRGRDLLGQRRALDHLAFDKLGTG